LRKRVSTLVLVLCGVLVLAVLNVNFLVRRNKDYLVGQLEQVLGRRIGADKIDVTFIPVGARVVGFTVADDPAFSGDVFLRAHELQADLRLLPLLIGQFRLRKLVLVSPLVTIVRNAKGEYNFASGAGDDKSDRNGGKNGKSLSAEKAVTPLIALLNISDGTLRYRDLKDGSELTVTQVDLRVNGFEQNEPFEIELEAAVGAARRNLSFKSRIGPIAGSHDYRDVFVEGYIRADALDLGKVNRALPQLKKALPKELRFDGVYTIQDLKFRGTLNNLSLKGAVTGTDASVRFE